MSASSAEAVEGPFAFGGASGAVDAGYRACRAVTRRHSRTFYLSSLFLSREQRRAVWAVYAFCRTADDVVDGGAPAAQRLALLEAWEAQLRAAFAGRPQSPPFAALADAAERFSIPLEPALDLLRGARMDVTVSRYSCYAELEHYCYLVASTVGLLVLPILGYSDPRAVAYGAMLGRAMQLTNIVRDVGEDARMGRIYLPLDELARFGVGEAAVLAGRIDEPFAALLRFQIARARDLYAQAEPGIALLAPRSRVTVRLASRLYAGILARVERNGYDVFTRRAFVPLHAKAALALRTRGR